MLRTAIVPQILPAYSSFVLYSFELNLRASAVIGLVGAGGIGQRLKAFTSNFDWESVSAIIVLFIIVVFVVDRLSTLRFRTAAGVSERRRRRCARRPSARARRTRRLR